jgi:hypothetical protein
MAVRTVNMALVYLMAFGLADAQDNGDKEKVRIHSSKSGNVHTFPAVHMYIRYVVHIIVLEALSFSLAFARVFSLAWK